MPDTTGHGPATAVKVVITGPVGVGKTTLVRTLSEIDVVTTERRVSLGGEQDPRSRTMALDFGRLTIDAALQLYLFGTPGQTCFDFMWDIIREGMLGFVILLDHARPDTVVEAIDILGYFTQRADVPFVVAVNRVPPGEETRALRMARHQLRIDETTRVIATDVRDRESAKHLLIELINAARDHGTRDHGTRDAASGTSASTGPSVKIDVTADHEPEHAW